MIPIQIKETDKSIQLLVGERKLTLHQEDILSLTADALVCPVDPTLSFRAGLARVISQAAGKNVRTERPLSPEPYGKVVVLPGGDLKVKFIFLTVLLGERGADKMRLSIAQAVDRTIRYAEFLKLKTIAFPVLGCPQTTPSYNIVAQEMFQNVIRYYQKRNTKLKTILFSAFNTEAFEAFRETAKNMAEM
jgi:O-acetyl-ADP-ribose deacetylase (regulator of RNase III)